MVHRLCGFILWLCLAASFSSGAQPPWGGTALVEPGSAAARRFSAVGRIANCTVFLIKASGAGAASPAYVMTAGHCLDLAANDVIVGRADTSRTAQFGVLRNATAPPLQIRSRQVVYSTMKEIDLAVLELDSTLGAMESAGLVPLVLSRSLPSPAAPYEWAGLPTGNVPSDERVLRTGPCAVSAVADVLEWRWMWRGQVRHDCSDISSGASGSPLIEQATGAVAAIIGTTNVGNSEPDSDGLCGRNDPCELRGASSAWVGDSSYATPVAVAAACFDGAGVFQLTAAGCGLDPGTQARVLEQRLTVRPGSSWNVAVSSDTLRFFRYKIFAQGAGDCRDEAGYGPPEALPGRISDRLPEGEGRYFACIVAGVSATPDSTWQPPKFATVVHLRVDGTAPAGPAQFSLQQTDRGYTFTPGASLSTGIIVKVDEAEASTCADLTTYRRIYPVPWFIPRGAVKRLCLVLEDGAGNAGDPVEIDVLEPAIFPVGVLAAAGYTHGRAAPGSWISIFGMNLAAADGAGTRVFVRSGGAEFALRAGYAADDQINALLPETVPVGPATLVVARAGRKEVSAPLRIDPAVPGLFTANARANSFGVIFGVGDDGTRRPTMVCASNGCTLTAIEGAREFEILAGGLAGVRPVRVTFSGQPVEVLAVSATEFPGVAQIRVRMPEGMRLRGFLPVRVSAGGAESGPAWVWLR